MPSSCCVRKCRSNYGNTDRIKVFKFLKDREIRRKRSRAIHRKYFYFVFYLFYVQRRIFHSEFNSFVKRICNIKD